MSVVNLNAMLSIIKTMPNNHRQLKTLPRQDTTPTLPPHTFRSTSPPSGSKQRVFPKETPSMLPPKHIPYDKETLYTEVLSLKISLNQALDQNIRLRTKLLAKEAEKASSRLESAGVRRSEKKKEGAVGGMRRILDSYKREVEQLTRQNSELKQMKSIRSEVVDDALITLNKELTDKVAVQQIEIEELKKVQERNAYLERKVRSLAQQIESYQSQLSTIQQTVKKVESSSGLIKAREMTTEVKARRLLSRIGNPRKGKAELSGDTVPRRVKSSHLGRIESLRKAPIPADKQLLVHSQKKKLPTHSDNEKLRKELIGLKQRIKTTEVKVDKLSGIYEKMSEKPVSGNQSARNIERVEKSHSVSSVRSVPLERQSVSVKLPSEEEIKELGKLLRLRLLAEKYPWSQLEGDIRSGGITELTYTDLCHLMVSQPFLLNVPLTKTALRYFLKQQSPSSASPLLPTQKLIAQLKQIIPDFSVPDQDIYRMRVQKCATLVTQKWQQVANKIEKEGFGSHVLPIGKLEAILMSFNLQSEQVELLLGEVAVCSDDLFQLNADVIKERFYLEGDLGAIQEEEEWMGRSGGPKEEGRMSQEMPKGIVTE